jgi:hypothetical protein
MTTTAHTDHGMSVITSDVVKMDEKSFVQVDRR